MTNSSAPLVLVDGSSYLYRAYHAMSQADLRNSAGQPTGAVRGVISMLRRLSKDFPSSPIAMVFDAKGKTFRDDIYAEYKANRPPMPDELRSQIEPIHNIINAMGVPLLIVDGVEADDVIGTLAKQATETGLDVVVSTGDKDMAQLVSGHVTLVNTMTETAMDREGVVEKFGIPPELIIDFLALMGDKVDNIPGVPGVGEKTALALLQNLGNLEQVYANLEKIADLPVRGAKNLGAKLAEHKDQAFLSYELATIKTDVALDVGPADIKLGAQDSERLLQLFQEMEFKSWVSELREPASKNDESPKNQAQNTEQVTTSVPVPSVAVEYETVFTQQQLTAWIEKLSAAEVFAFDTETTSLDYMEARIVGVSFAVEPGKAAYVPCGHDYVGAPEQLKVADVLQQLKPLLEDPNKAKLGQNLKYDKSVLANHDVDLRGIKFDTMLESYVMNSIASRHDMDTLALKYLGHETIHFEDIAGKGAKQLTFNAIDVDQASTYAAEDADITLKLHHALWPNIAAHKTLTRVFFDIEMPLVPVLSRMERNGAYIDKNALSQQSEEISHSLEQLQQKAYELAGEEFNLSSPKQLGTILFEKLKLPVTKKTPKGAASTAEEVLQELALDYPLPEVIMNYRMLAKLKSTYTDKLHHMVNPRTGRVHTSYHQAVAATGRLSSTDPNLQNIPIRTEQGRRVRQAFIAEPGNKIVAADYSQIELRIMAHLSQDQGLLKAFAKGLDIHSATAAEVFSTRLEDVSSEQRRSAKAINFGLIYGMSAFGLARQLRIGRREAQQYIDLYFDRYPGVLRYMDSTRQTAREQGFIETILGRRLYLPEINDRNPMRRQAAERTAINAPMQGTAADIMKLAMIAIDEWLGAEQPATKLIMQVHDELVLEVPQQDIEIITEGVRQRMQSALSLSVPLEVEVGVGANWDQAH